MLHHIWSMICGNAIIVLTAGEIPQLDKITGTANATKEKQRWLPPSLLSKALELRGHQLNGWSTGWEWERVLPPPDVFAKKMLGGLRRPHSNRAPILHGSCVRKEQGVHRNIPDPDSAQRNCGVFHVTVWWPHNVCPTYWIKKQILFLRNTCPWWRHFNSCF